MPRRAVRRNAQQFGLNFIRNDGVTGSNPVCGTKHIKQLAQSAGSAKNRRVGTVLANRLPHLLLKDFRMSVEANPVLPPGDNTLSEHLGYACDLIARSLCEITEPPHEDVDREWFRRMSTIETFRSPARLLVEFFTALSPVRQPLRQSILRGASFNTTFRRPQSFGRCGTIRSLT